MKRRDYPENVAATPLATKNGTIWKDFFAAAHTLAEIDFSVFIEEITGNSSTQQDPTFIIRFQESVRENE